MRILLIGTGRMAYHLGHNLVRAGLDLIGVTGRDNDKANDLGRFLDRTVFRMDRLPANADVVIIATSDDSIAEVSAKLAYPKAVFSHTAGAAGLELLAPHAHRAVLWPIQTLSHGAPIDLSDVPLVVDANTSEAREAILRIARAVSGSVVELAHAQRKHVHLAAVLASNLPVFLVGEAQRLLKEQRLPPGLLMPLWRTTAQNVGTIGPDQALTGPARRGDISSIQGHLDQLASESDLRRAYALLSTMVLKAHGHSTDGIDV